MRDAHILDGDYAIGDPDVMPSDRSVVIAFVDGGYTLKTLRRLGDGSWWLEPANDAYRPIIPCREDDRVEAAVLALFRPRIARRPPAQPW